ncbi:MAG: hypothetical protein ABGY32_02145 [bacterium]
MRAEVKGLKGSSRRYLDKHSKSNKSGRAIEYIIENQSTIPFGTTQRKPP